MGPEFSLSKMDVNRISFDQLKAYWVEVDHFGVAGKKFRNVVRTLGDYRSTLADPARFSYGLFDSGELIGVTHLVQWDEDWLRYRTLNIRQAYRSRNLGWYLLRTAVAQDWKDRVPAPTYIFGWVRREHQAWSITHGFTPADGRWVDGHIAMIKPLAEF